MVKRKRNASSTAITKRFKTEPKLYKIPSISFRTSPLPLSLGVKLRYHSITSITSGGAGFTSVHVFRANGLYDPDISGIGNQPRGFDQLMTMYSHYVVTGAKISVNFSQQAASLYPQATIIGICVKRDAVTSVLPQDYTEDSTRVMTHMPGSAANQDAADRTLTMYCPIAKFLGRSNLMSDPDLKGTTAANPVEQADFHVFACPVSSSTTMNTLSLSVMIEYYATLIEPVNPTQS